MRTMIELPVTQEVADRVLAMLNDPDTRASVEVTFGTEKVLGRWHVFAARKESGPDGEPLFAVSLDWAGR